MLFIHLLFCAFFIKCCAGAYIYIEDGKRKAFTRFPLPVIDGFIQTTEKSIDVLEFRELDTNEGTELNLIANFPELKYINISYMNFEKLPKFINLPRAEWLIFMHNKLTKIPFNSISSLPLLEVGFTRNQISVIEDGAIGSKVVGLYLDCNSLTDISERWFETPANLKTLNLQLNKITTIEENLFHSFTNLETLDLSYNKIISIGNGAFSTLSTMKHLNLQTNQISVLQPEIFGPSINITVSFNIGRNRLNFLSKDLLRKLTLKQFVILGNPWQCPCLREIEKWMNLNVNDTSYKTYLLKWKETNPVCIVASSFSKQCVELVDEDLYKSYAENLNVVNKVCL